MKIQHKELGRPVIVITGASSGIGLNYCKGAARESRMLLAARNGDALQEIANELNIHVNQAAFVVTDVGIGEPVHHVGEAAMEYFDCFDTRVDKAGVSIFGRNEEV
jgi:NADP-dependent 3-hydroxy acid dehydrogenase YdfG